MWEVDCCARDRPLPGTQRSRLRRVDLGCGRDVLALGGRALRDFRAHSVSMVYQNPGAALNPSMRVGAQVAEAFTVLGASSSDARERTQEALARVQIADPSIGHGAVPAPALRRDAAARRHRDGARKGSCAPDPRRADHRSRRNGRGGGARSGLATQAELHTAGALHQPQPRRDLEDVLRASVCSMRGGSSRKGRSETVLQDPRHPYTVGLLRCIPRGGVRKDHGRLDTIPGFLPSLGADIAGCVFADRCALADERCRTEEPPLIAVEDRTREPLLVPRARTRPSSRGSGGHRATRPVARAGPPVVEIDELTKMFKQRGHEVHALTEVSAAIWPGETLGLVGESGSGKTTLARTLLGIVPPTTGTATARGPRRCRPVTRSARARSCVRCRSCSRTPTRR